MRGSGRLVWLALALLPGMMAVTMPPLQPDGSFFIENVVDEPLTLSVYENRTGSYHVGPKSPDLLVSMPVQAGDGAINIALPGKKRP